MQTWMIQFNRMHCCSDEILRNFLTKECGRHTVAKTNRQTEQVINGFRMVTRAILGIGKNSECALGEDLIIRELEF